MRDGARLALAVAAIGGLLAACPQGADGGAVGREGKVRFRASTDLVFSQKLAVGSAFSVSAEPEGEDVSLGGATFESSDDDVLVVEDLGSERAKVSFKGAGAAELRVKKDGKVVDAVSLRAGKAVSSVLVDAALLAATDQVDARLPKTFALVSGEAVSLAVASVDSCGNDLLDLGASTLEPTGVQSTVEPAELNGFVVEPAEKGELSLVLKTPGLDDLTYDVDVTIGDDVDEVQAAVAAAEENQAVMWGRAFADGSEVVGALAFSWRADERVSLSANTGASVTVEIAMPGADQPPDDRPATVTVELDDVEHQVDLFALTEVDLVKARGEPARSAPEPVPTGCGGDTTCGALFSVFALRRLRVRAIRHG